METIIKTVRGDKLEADNCTFCGSSNGCVSFGIIDGERHDGILIRHFGVCKEHLEKINSLLSGDFDIDRIDLEQYRKAHIGRGLRLR